MPYSHKNKTKPLPSLQGQGGASPTTTMNQNKMKLPEIIQQVKSPAKFCKLRRRKGETSHHYRLRHISKAVSQTHHQSWEQRLLEAFRKELL